jgi:hypothetical protein
MRRLPVDSLALLACMPLLLSLCAGSCTRHSDSAGRSAPPFPQLVSKEALADALLKAIDGHDIDAVRVALRDGADPNGPGSGQRVLGQAILAHDQVIVRELIRAGADVNATTLDGAGSPMVLLAAFSGEPAIVRILLQAGANPNASSKHGMTALAEAAVADANLVCEPLVQAGSNINAWTLWPGHIYAGETQTTTPTRGRTPLMIAASMGNSKTVGALLALGANAELKNERGETAFDLVGKEVNPLELIRSDLSIPERLRRLRR